jgi:hypothetical protein
LGGLNDVVGADEPYIPEDPGGLGPHRLPQEEHVTLPGLDERRFVDMDGIATDRAAFNGDQHPTDVGVAAYHSIYLDRERRVYISGPGEEGGLLGGHHTDDDNGTKGHIDLLAPMSGKPYPETCIPAIT